MAPECLDNKPYNLKADVYSFSIILWEILSESIPFGFVKRRRTLIQQVVHENARPIIDKRRWPASIVGMLESSFEAEIGLRPVSYLLSRHLTFIVEINILSHIFTSIYSLTLHL